jgi:cytosine/adenosine deaminase-related metal-dependent hydrolase
MILRARIVVPMDGPPIADGAVKVDGNKIVAVGTFADLGAGFGGEVNDLGEVALLPGFINAHCHLDYTILRHAISPPKSFSAWVQRINAIKRSLGPEDYLKSIARGFDGCIKWGTTTVFNIESFPELMPHLPPPPIRTWWFYEMIDIRHRITTEDVVAGALSFFQHRSGNLSNFGLSPHAPFTASLELFRLSNNCAQAFNMPLTTHVAESYEEFEMFHDARGPLYSFLESIGRPMGDCGKGTPFELLWRAGAINGQWILAHMNELTESDFDLLGSVPQTDRPTIVHCPSSHRYFNHSPFAWQRLQQMGINLCVGTDSLASCDSLSLLGELRQLSDREPSLSGEQLLHSVTRSPARALRREHSLGRIRAGALADLIAVPVSGTLAAVHEEIVEYTRPIPWMMIDGEIRQYAEGH